MLKEQTAKSMGIFSDYAQLAGDMRSGMRLLELTYSTYGIAAPRKGHGAFKKMEALPVFTLELGANALDAPVRDSVRDLIVCMSICGIRDRRQSLWRSSRQ